MAGHGIAADAATRDARLDAYLAELADRLRGPRRCREAILAELADGLSQATRDRCAAGLPPPHAAAAAIARFGTPQAVADGFAGELATAYARHTLLWFLATGPLVGLWWLLLAHPDPRRDGVVALLAAVPVIPLIAVAIVTLGGTLATTGRLMRWLPETGPRRALAATVTVAVCCIAGDLTMITMLVASGVPVGPLGAIAAAGSLVRIACSAVVVRHATRMRRR